MKDEDTIVLNIMRKLMNICVYKPTLEVFDKSFQLVEEKAVKDTGKKLTFSKRYHNKFLNNKYRK